MTGASNVHVFIRYLDYIDEGERLQAVFDSLPAAMMYRETTWINGELTAVEPDIFSMIVEIVNGEPGPMWAWRKMRGSTIGFWEESDR